MTVDSVETRWGPITGPMLKRLKDGYAAARRDSQTRFEIDGQVVLTDFAKYLIEYCEMEGLVAS